MRPIQLKPRTKVIESLLTPGIACGEMRHGTQSDQNQKPRPQETLRLESELCPCVCHYDDSTLVSAPVF
jgi:hypothetical protein